MSSGNTSRMSCMTSLSPQLVAGRRRVGGARGGRGLRRRGGRGRLRGGRGLGGRRRSDDRRRGRGLRRSRLGGGRRGGASAARSWPGRVPAGGTVAGTVPGRTIGGSGATVRASSRPPPARRPRRRPGGCPACTTSPPLLRAISAAIGVTMTPAAKQDAEANGERIARGAAGPIGRGRVARSGASHGEASLPWPCGSIGHRSTPGGDDGTPDTALLRPPTRVFPCRKAGQV